MQRTPLYVLLRVPYKLYLIFLALDTILPVYKPDQHQRVSISIRDWPLPTYQHQIYTNVLWLRWYCGSHLLSQFT